MPVGFSNGEDRCIWRGTNNGIFYVKSAYHLQLEIEALNGATSSLQVGNSTVWSTLWAQKIPNVRKKTFCGRHVTRFCLLGVIYKRGKLLKILCVHYVELLQKQPYIFYGSVLQLWMLGCLECGVQENSEEKFYQCIVVSTWATCMYFRYFTDGAICSICLELIYEKAVFSSKKKKKIIIINK